MAGHRRRRIELPEPGKPVAEMTADERAAYVTALRQALRDDEVRRGKRKPRTMRETEIFLDAPGKDVGHPAGLTAPFDRSNGHY